MFLNPRAPVASIALDKIQDPGVREAVRNMIRTLEAIYGGVAQSANFNMAKLVAQPSQPEVAEGESVVWQDTDAPEGAPMAYILARVQGQLFRFPTDQLSGGGSTPEPSLPTLLNITPASVTIDEGAQTTLTVNLTAAVPGGAGTQTVNLTSTDATIASVSPLQISIGEGQSAGVCTLQGNSAGACSIIASYNNSQVSCTVTVNQVTPPGGGTPDFFQTFETIQYANIGFNVLRFDQYLIDSNPLYQYQIQCKDTATPANNVFQSAPGRHGGVSIVLRTRGNDTGVSGSGSNERCDLNPMSGNPGATDGQEFWWAHSIFIPSGFLFPGDPSPSFAHWHIVMQFHDNSGQPPIPLEIVRYRSGAGFPTHPMWRVRITSGEPESEKIRVHPRNQEQITDNSWYDFVWHIKWSQASDGFCRMWLRKNNESIGKQEINFSGATKSSASVNFKPANYHSYVPGAGNNTDVYHDRILRGSSPQDVSMFQLEGVPTF